MANGYMRTQFEPLGPRALLSHFDLGAVPAELPMKAGQRQALVGSIQGTENSSTRVVYYINASGAVSPLGEVAVTGSFGGDRGALNDKGTLTFTNSQGSLTLSLKTHGYFPLESQNEEEIRMTVQVRSASGSYARIHVAGTINLVNSAARGNNYRSPGPVPFRHRLTSSPRGKWKA